VGYQQETARQALEDASTRNLSSRMLNGRVGGGMKSTGTITKSPVMRAEN